MPGGRPRIHPEGTGSTHRSRISRERRRALASGHVTVQVDLPPDLVGDLDAAIGQDGDRATFLLRAVRAALSRP